MRTAQNKAHLYKKRACIVESVFCVKLLLIEFLLFFIYSREEIVHLLMSQTRFTE